VAEALAHPLAGQERSMIEQSLKEAPP